LEKETKESKKNVYHHIRDVTQVNEVQLESLDKLILYVLESRGVNKYPSHERIAWECGTSISSVKRSLKKLKTLNLVTWKRYTNRSNWYYLNCGEIEFWKEKSNSRFLEEAHSKQDLQNYKPNWDVIDQKDDENMLD
jgi:hypothetical protein